MQQTITGQYDDEQKGASIENNRMRKHQGFWQTLTASNNNRSSKLDALNYN
jgi:hypothetical protein